MTNPDVCYCKYWSHLVCFPRHFGLTPVTTLVTFCIFANYATNPSLLEVNVESDSSFVFSQVPFSDCLMPPDEGFNKHPGFQIPHPSLSGWAENVPFYLHPGLMRFSGGSFCLRKVSCQPRVCLAPSCNQTSYDPFSVHAFPTLLAVYVCLAAGEGGVGMGTETLFLTVRLLEALQASNFSVHLHRTHTTQF